jgi:hypothetical protein
LHSAGGITIRSTHISPVQTPTSVKLPPHKGFHNRTADALIDFSGTPDFAVKQHGMIDKHKNSAYAPSVRIITTQQSVFLQNSKHAWDPNRDDNHLAI